MSRAAWAAALVLLVTPFLPTPVAGAPSFVPTWWPPGNDDLAAHLGDGWNLRIPVRIQNPAGQSLSAGTPAQVHLDLGASILPAGWPSDDGPQGAFPRSFHADPASIRLVRYTTGWASLVSEVPVHVFPAWLEPDQTAAYGKVQSGPFHGQRNAVVTLEWLTPAPVAPFDTDHYYVYFEITQNSVKPAAALADAAVELHDALYWVSRGTTFYGFHPGGGPTSPSLDIVALEDGTLVNVSAYRGGSFPQLDNRPNSGNPTSPFVLDAGAVQTYSLGVSPTNFRVDATRPVLVQSRTEAPEAGGAFVPSIDQTLLGRTFRVPAASQAILLLSPPNATGAGANIVVSSPTGATLLQAPVAASSYRFFAFPSVNPAAFYHVTATAPILVQYAPTDTDASLAQAATVRGSAVGSQFMGASVSAASGRYALSSYDGPSHVRIIDRTGPSWTTYQSDLTVTPPQPLEASASAVSLVPAANPAWRTSVPATVEVLDADEAPEGERAPIQLWLGNEGSGAARLVTPFGGRHGLEFRTQGPIVVFPFYGATHVEIVDHSDGDAVTELDLGEGVPTHIERPLQSTLTIRADKPISVLPRDDDAEFARFLAARPPFLPVVVGPGEYRGFLVELVAPGNADPYFVNGVPGQTLQVPFQVRNLGRDSDGGPLSDTIELAFVADPPDWGGLASFATPQMTVAGNTPVSTFLEVTLPDDMVPDTAVSFTIRATSQGNANMTSSFTAIVFNRQTFGVEMWFGEAQSTAGPDSLFGHQIAPGSTELFPFVVRNTGTGPDTFDLSLAQVSGGWQADILRGNTVVDHVAVPGKEQVGLKLQLRAPLSDQVGQTFVRIDAFSRASDFASDQLLLDAELNLGSDFSLNASQPVQRVAPGGIARFVVEANNFGRQPVTVLLSVTADLPVGWSFAFNGTSDPRSEPLTIAQGGSVPLVLELHAPASARAGTLVGLLVTGRGATEGSTVRDSVGLAASVDVRHSLQLTPPASVRAAPGAGVAAQIALQNAGNAPEQVRLRPLNVPSGWNLTLPSLLNLAPGASGTLTFSMRVAAGYPAGPTTTSWAVETADGTRFPFNLTIAVDELRHLEWGPAAPLVARPGEAGTLHLRIANTGNVADRLTLDAQGPTGWVVRASPADADVPMGVGRAIRLAWTVPLGAADGDHNLTVVARSAEDGSVQELRIPVRVTSARVEVERVLLPDPLPANLGTLFVTVLLRNPTLVPAVGIEARLQTGSDVLDSVRFEAIGANGTAVAVLRWSLAEAAGRPVDLVWGPSGPDGLAVEGTRRVELDAHALEAKGESPAPGVVLALVALAGATALRPRREGRRR